MYIIFQAEKRRNDFVHEFFNVLAEGLKDEDTILLGKIISLYQRLDSWWVFNIEIATDEVSGKEKITQGDCNSLSVLILNIVKDIVLGNDKPYSGWMEQIREDVQEQRKQKGEK